MAALLRHISETPLVITNHGLISQTAPGTVQALYLPTVGRFTFNSADRVLCYTETDKKRLRKRGVTAPISVVHNGIDTSKFRPLSEIETEEQLLYVGRLKRSKGVHRLLRAFARIAESFPSLTVSIVGKGPERSNLVELAKQLDIDQRVLFKGEIPNDQLPKLYNKAKVFVIPSDAEGLPRAVLEAMSCGTPVIVSDLPQLKQLVANNGYVVPAEDIDELANVIYRILDEESTYRSMRENAHSYVQSQYS